MTHDLYHLCWIVCDYKGQQIPIGMTKPAGDDCNTCTCRPNGRLECTEKICCKYCFHIKVSYFSCMSISYEHERHYDKISHFFKIIFARYFNFCSKLSLASLTKTEFEDWIFYSLRQNKYFMKFLVMMFLSFFFSKIKSADIKQWRLESETASRPETNVTNVHVNPTDSYLVPIGPAVSRNHFIFDTANVYLSKLIFGHSS